MEERALLSGLLVALQAPTPQLNIPTQAEVVSTRSHSSAAVAAAAVGGAGGATGGSPTGNSSTALAGVYSGNGVLNNPTTGTPIGPNATALFPPVALLGSGTPTKAELAREKFVAQFTGPMVSLAPRFTDQSKILYIRGLGGSTPNFFLHADYSLALVFPAGFDPKNPGGTAATTVTAPDGTTTTIPGVPPVTGFAFLDDKNNNSGGVVGLDLLADPTSFDAKGRPTRVTFTSDPNVYGGIFYVDQSAGVATIKYGKNTATTSFNGRIYTSGLTNPFQNVDLYAKHSG